MNDIITPVRAGDQMIKRQTGVVYDILNKSFSRAFKIEFQKIVGKDKAVIVTRAFWGDKVDDIPVDKNSFTSLENKLHIKGFDLDAAA